MIKIRNLELAIQEKYSHKDTKTQRYTKVKVIEINPL